MTKLVLQSVDPTVHLIRESSRDGKGRRLVSTKCGVEVGRDEALVTAWNSDVTCPQCATPWDSVAE